jgi:diaminopimelate epimerase
MKNGYYLADACHNTFLIWDCIDLPALDESARQCIHSNLLKENRDDAMILISGRPDEDALAVQMLVLGVDGLMGDFCGNGSRACAAYLFSHYPQYRHFYLVSPRGRHHLLRYSDGTYSTQLPPINFNLNSKFIARPNEFSEDGSFYYLTFNAKRLFYADAIEPHLIVENEIGDDELLDLGRAVNQRTDLFPLGINVNAIRILGSHSIRVRTYERGVQRLTQSCGTGSCCSAAWYLKDQTGEVRVTTLGGQLEISLLEDALRLRGPATIEGYQTF